MHTDWSLIHACSSDRCLGCRLGLGANLKLVKGILCAPNLVQSNSNIAAQHTGALVDEQAAPEVVLCHLILLLPEIYLAHPIPAVGNVH